MVMACPLSAIVNDRDQSPRGNRRQLDGDEFSDDRMDPSDPTTPTKNMAIRPKHTAHLPIAHIISVSPMSEAKEGPLHQSRGHRKYDSLPRPLIHRQSSPTIRRMKSEPPSYELDFRAFSVFKSILKHAELTFELSKHLDVDELVSLYAISKDFHSLVNGRFTHMILLQAKQKAHESSSIFSFHCYQPLCQRDPAARPLTRIPNTIRWVPTFRWLRMILFRERVVEEIIECLSAEGHFMPERVRLTIKKIWFTIDIGNNHHRIGILHNREFWTNNDIYLATLFFIKLDIRFTHPITGNGEVGLRKMLLGQRSLSTLLSVLKRQQLLTQTDLMRMIVEFDYQLTEQESGKSLFDVPSHMIGKLSCEGWGMTAEKFLQVDELVMREAIRRNLDVQDHYMDMILYGYLDKINFEDVWHTGGGPAYHDGVDDQDQND